MAGEGKLSERGGGLALEGQLNSYESTRWKTYCTLAFEKLAAVASTTCDLSLTRGRDSAILVKSAIRSGPDSSLPVLTHSQLRCIARHQEKASMGRPLTELCQDRWPDVFVALIPYPQWDV